MGDIYMDFNLRDRTILLVVGGSRAYGIHLPTSDVDVKGVGIATAAYYHGFLSKWEQAEGNHMTAFADTLTPEETAAMIGTKLEGTVYDIRKFVTLAADANPNILDVLFCRDEEVRVTSKLGNKLREARDLFLSAKAKHTFSGYAASQLKRIKGHRAWLLNPPDHQPLRAEFDLPENTLIPADQLMAAQAAVQKQVDSWEFDFSGMNDAEIIHVTEQVKGYLTGVMANLGYPNPTEATWLAAARAVGLDSNLIYVMQKEREYEAAARYWKQYQDWKKNRNEARAVLEAKYGYDCYLDDTEFLTERGWLRYDEVTAEDRLATLNQATGVVEYQHFTDRVAKPHTGKIGIINPRNCNCAVTMNHRMWVSPVHRSSANGFSRAYVPETAEWGIQPLHELVEGRRSGFHVRVAGVPTNEDYAVDDWYLDLLAAYVSEGCVGKRLADGTASVVRLSQKVGGRMEPLLEALKRDNPEKMCHFAYVRDEAWRDSPCVEGVWTFADPEVAHRLEMDCGSGSLNKKLPDWTRLLSRRQVERLLHGMLAGDGTGREHSSVYYTASKRLADDIQTMCVHAGIATQVWGPYPNGEDSPMYQVYVTMVWARMGMLVHRLDTSVVFTHLAENSDRGFVIEEVQNARVVCFTVPNEILVTRRQGSVAIQGNTKHAGHLVRLLKMGREILETGKVHVWRGAGGPGDAEEIRAIRNGAWEYDKLIEWAEAEDNALEQMYRERKYVVAKQPNRDALNKLCIELVETALSEGVLR